MPQQGKYTAADLAPDTAPDTTSQQSSGGEAPDDDRNAVQRYVDNLSTVTPEQRVGHSTPVNMLQDFGAHVIGSVAGPFVHPLETLKGFGRLAAQASTPQGQIEAAKEIAEPIAQDFSDNGASVAIPHILGDAVGTYLGGEGVNTILRAPGVIKDFVRGPVNTPPAGSTVAPRMRFEAAKRLGVNLDAADATGNPFLGNLKKINENSLFGGHLYDNLKTANTGALQGSTDSFLNDLYEGDRESGGRDILDALRNDQHNLKSGAESGFEQLTEQTKGKPVKGAPAVGKTAKSLLKTIEPLSNKYPSLAPGKTISVLSDLARVGGRERPPIPTGFLDAPDSEFAVPRKIAPAVPDTWSDLQRLRSATHDLTTTNPDLVKSQAIAPLQQMTSSLDDAMTNASSGLTPAQTEIFRDANSKWKDMKETYDDPSSPFYHAVRTDNPSTLYSRVGPQTPENAINLRRRLSPFESMTGVGPNGAITKPSRALGALRRGTVESALKTNSEGAPNFRNFGMNWNRVPADYRAELFSPDQNVKLQDITHTSNVLGKDFNPSGSGKLGQKVAEAAALVPTLGAPVLQWPLAKLMTSPKAVEWLMHPGTRPNPFVGPGTVATAASSRKIGESR
jgi:hypothetical protein